MLWELLEWLHLVDQNALQDLNLNLKTSNFIFLIYLITIKKSWHFAVAFFICETAYLTEFAGFLSNMEGRVYSVMFYLCMSFLWCVCIGAKITLNMNKNLAAWCIIMITFLLLMALDSWINASTETYIYANHSTIIMFIHVGIVVSLYGSSSPVSLLVDNICRRCRRCIGSYSLQFIWYTANNYKATMAQRWLTLMRQL